VLLEETQEISCKTLDMIFFSISAGEEVRQNIKYQILLKLLLAMMLFILINSTNF
jgi:hypothetical protein